MLMFFFPIIIGGHLTIYLTIRTNTRAQLVYDSSAVLFVSIFIRPGAETLKLSVPMNFGLQEPTEPFNE